MCWHRGTSAPSVLLDVWYNNNIANEGRRAVLTSIAVPVANLTGVVSSNIFRNQDAPRYMPALITTASCGGTGILLTLLLGGWMMMDNARRDRVQGGRFGRRMSRRRGYMMGLIVLISGGRISSFRRIAGYNAFLT